MKIHEYYRDTANVSLNGSIAALVPTIIIVGGNLSFFQNKQIMLLTIPFLLYSFIAFQIYLFKLKQAISICRKMTDTESFYQSLFEVRHLLVVFLNTQSSKLLLYYPDGHQAGIIKRFRGKGLRYFMIKKIYALYNLQGEVLGYFKIKGKRKLTIEVFDSNHEFLGSYVKEKRTWVKANEELFDASGRFIGVVEGSRYFMDEKVLDPSRQQVSRLRRGWMPLEWSNRFPESNTPVLSFSEGFSEKDKLLRMAFLINEFFIER